MAEKNILMLGITLLVLFLLAAGLSWHEAYTIQDAGEGVLSGISPLLFGVLIVGIVLVLIWLSVETD